MALAEQIAVLDGLDVSTIDIDDGRIGQKGAQVDEYGRKVMPGVLTRSHVIDASEGANYSGGSDYAPGLPLLPSSVGLAGFGNIPNVLPTRRHVIDYSGGANYSGGSDFAPGLPLLPSSAGLAAAGVDVNSPTIQGGYGAAGFGNAGGSAADQDLAGAFNGLDDLAGRDGRIGQQRAQVDEYGRPIMPGVLSRRGVIDASEGANYSGGSAYAPGLPLLPSSIGLAGVNPDAPTIEGGYGAAGFGALDELDAELQAAAWEADPLDGLSDLQLGRLFRRRARRVVSKSLGARGAAAAVARRLKIVKRVAPSSKVKVAVKSVGKIARAASRTRSPKKRRKMARKVRKLRSQLAKMRKVRSGVMARGMVGGVYTQASLPYNPSRPSFSREAMLQAARRVAASGRFLARR